MLVEVPFYKNTENACMQVAMQCVLKHFLNKEYSIQELDKITKRKEGLWTWTSQAVSALYNLGLDIKFYGKTDLELFLKGEEFIREQLGDDAEKVLKFSDMPVVIESIKTLIDSKLFEKRVLNFDEIEKHLKEGTIPIMLIDNNKILGKEDFYQGHFVIVTGFDEQNIFYHDSGPKNPEPNKKVPKDTFLKAWNANGTDNDLILVFGKRVQ